MGKGEEMRGGKEGIEKEEEKDRKRIEEESIV